MNAGQVKEFVRTLSTFEAEVPKMDQSRSRILDRLRNNNDRKDTGEALSELEGLVEWRRELGGALELLELALKNSAATFARFEAKAAKDGQLLAEMRKRAGAPAFDDKHAILIAQRQAYARAAQKLDFLSTELDKLSGAIDNKYAVKNLPELAGLSKALAADRDAWDGLSKAKKAVQRFLDAADTHHLEL